MKRYRFIGTEEDSSRYLIKVKYGDIFYGDFSMTPTSDTIALCARNYRNEWEEVRDNHKIASDLTTQIFEIINSSEHSGAEAEEHIIELLERNL